MRILWVIPIALLLLFGCPKPEEKVDFKLGYLLIDADGQKTEGTFDDSISFPRDSTYFHIRANITSRDSITNYLKVLDQKYDIYEMRVPLYSEEAINGADRSWTGVTGLEGGTESLVPLEPGIEKSLEQPVFFFNQVVGPGMPGRMELRMEIVNASGSVLGTKIIPVTITE